MSGRKWTNLRFGAGERLSPDTAHPGRSSLRRATEALDRIAHSLIGRIDLERGSVVCNRLVRLVFLFIVAGSNFLSGGEIRLCGNHFRDVRNGVIDTLPNPGGNQCLSGSCACRAPDECARAGDDRGGGCASGEF
jgi:hypothetical protein